MHSSGRITALVCGFYFGSLLGCGTGSASDGAGSGGTGGAAGNTLPAGGSGNGASAGAPGAGSGATAASSQAGMGNPGGGANGGSAGAAGSGGATMIPPADRGATLPFLEYEAETGDTNGMVLGPSRKTGISNDVAAESSQRKAVKLSATGQYVKIKSTNAANSIVVRVSVPDSADGQGAASTLSVYVNGTFKQKLNVTSRYSWTYGTAISPSSNNPADGNAHHFYDETHAIVGDIPVGATVAVQKDADDSAAYYVVDLIDLENVGAPLPAPANFISIADCGATPNDASDDRAAIQSCIDKAKTANRGLYIPQGTFNVLSKANDKDTAGLNIDNVTIRGAGMWYSTLSGIWASLYCYGNNCKYSDFAVFGDTTNRDDNGPNSDFGGPTGSGSSLSNIWMEHSTTGYWVGPNANGLTVSNCRIRDLYADGVNFYGGTSNSTVTQTHFRNTGDDAMASWSRAPVPGFTPGTNTNNAFTFNTVQAPWLANCFGIYGGNDTKVEDNICSDTVMFPGILIAQQFDSMSFGGTTTIARNSLERDGGFDFGDGQCALKLFADQGAMSGFLLKDLLISDSSY
ncbi:MAG TPA: glycosyl hydrolase family 28-related protein, partial [Polyangiaceae bacterium]|nr:glycosyl hydrolase family 28-related protein [Polyangiaceae bacterium]